MSWSFIQERWEEYRAAAKRKWDRLSEQQLRAMRGNREYLLKRVQEAYSLTRDEAEGEVAAWQRELLAKPGEA